MIRSLTKIAVALYFVGFASTASATIIYDNGGPDDPNFVDGNEATGWIQAEDFVLSEATTVTDAHVYVAAFNFFPETIYDYWDGTSDYYIFSDAGGQPAAGAGGILASGSGQNVTVTDSGIPWFTLENSLELSFDLESAFVAAAGTTYWFGIHLASDFIDIDDIYWVTTAANSTVPGYESYNGTLDNWGVSFGGYEHAFYLTSVPEPSTLVLLALGITGIGYQRRKRILAAWAP